MQANLQDQQTLLKISEIDTDIARAMLGKEQLLDATEIARAREELFAIADQLIDARNRVAELDSELSRFEADLGLVEKRIQRDRDALGSTSSAKDVQGIEHELDTLAKRKSDLEDQELGIMEALEIERAELARIENSKEEVSARLSSLEAALAKDVAALDEQAANLKNLRVKTMATLSPELASAYQLKAARGVAVGRLIGRECGACRLSITATDFDDITSQAADSLPQCPNCSAFLVRS